MKEQIEKLMISLVGYAIGGQQPSPEELQSITPDMLRQLYKLSGIHDLAHLMYDALNKLQLLPDDREIVAAFYKQKLTAVYRCENLQYKLRQLCDAFEGEEIPYMPLKGSVLRKYYPEPWMRTSCDIDILVPKDRLDDAVTVLTDRLHYSRKQENVNDIVFVSSEGIHLELHHDLLDSEIEEDTVLSQVWKTAVSTDESHCHCVMSYPLFYYYHIAHIARHFRQGGAGVRPILDLWILERTGLFCRQECNGLLEQGGLLTFADEMRKICDIWFNNVATDEFSDKVQKFMFSSGVHGNISHYIAIRHMQKRGKGKEMLLWIFPSYEKMCENYPVIKKHKWLYPFCHVRRWIKYLLPYRAKQTKKKVQIVSSITDDTKESIATMLEQLGL